MKITRYVFLTILFVIAGAMAVSYFSNLENLPDFLRLYRTRGGRMRSESSELIKIQPIELKETELIVPAQWRSVEFGVSRFLKVPNGWRVNVFASKVPKARFFAMRDDGVLFLSLSGEGKVVALPDKNKDGVADRVITMISGLDFPHGLAWLGDWLYVAETGRVMRYRDLNGDYIPDLKQSVVPSLPSGGNHISRTIAFGPEGDLYVSIGSSCNVCVDDPRRAVILKFDENGEREEIFASGLRNAVGMVFHPETGELYVTDNGRDFLGDDEPPDEVNIVKRGGNYGWPSCFGDKRPDPDLKTSEEYCEATEAPFIKMQAHSAPLGLRFLEDERIPSEYKGSLLIAFHGSWNRSVPTGYKIFRARSTPTGEVVGDDFATGWLEGTNSWGRPVDVIVGADGAVYVSDDKAGAVYRFEPPNKE